MSRTVYLHLLFFCVIVCQGIFATLSDTDTRLSSNSLVRKRRVINHLPAGRSMLRIERANYVVRLREANRARCGAVILSHYTVITAALCINQPLSNYKILSGGATNNVFISHNVTSVVSHSGNPPHQLIDGIALLTVDPPFEFNKKTGNIELYTGPLFESLTVTVFGWGYMYPLQPGRDSKLTLRSITLPIMNHEQCKNVYRHQLNITDKHICTYHSQQYCAHCDEGAPLLVRNKLAGIHIVKEAYPNQVNPDIFINLQRPDYREWILSNTLLM